MIDGCCSVVEFIRSPDSETPNLIVQRYTSTPWIRFKNRIIRIGLTHLAARTKLMLRHNHYDFWSSKSRSNWFISDAWFQHSFDFSCSHFFSFLEAFWALSPRNEVKANVWGWQPIIFVKSHRDRDPSTTQLSSRVNTPIITVSCNSLVSFSAAYFLTLLAVRYS